MPAATLEQLTDRLTRYADPNGPPFAEALSGVLERIYSLGLWQDITDERVLTVQRDLTISIPRDTDTVLHWILNESPAGPIRPLWHDYRLLGKGANPPSAAGLVDAGYRATRVPLAAAGHGLFYVVASNDDYRTANWPGPGGGGHGTLVVEATDGTKIYRQSNETLPAYAFGFGYDSGDDSFETVSEILSIRYTDFLVPYDIRTDENDPDSVIATVGPGSGVCRYRTFRVNGSQPDDSVRVLLKRRPPALTSTQDIVHIGNHNALKHGLLAVLAEENADLERSQFHWTECVRILNEELGTLDVGHQFALNIDLTGHGGLPVQTIL